MEVITALAIAGYMVIGYAYGKRAYYASYYTYIRNNWEWATKTFSFLWFISMFVWPVFLSVSLYFMFTRGPRGD